MKEISNQNLQERLAGLDARLGVVEVALWAVCLAALSVLFFRSDSSLAMMLLLSVTMAVTSTISLVRGSIRRRLAMGDALQTEKEAA